MSAWRLIGAVLALAAYAVLSHLLMVHAAKEPWAVAALFGPLLVGVVAAAWPRRQWLTLMACAALVAWLAAIVLQGGVADINRMYVLQHAGIHLALAWSFGLSLRTGSTPLITAMAQRLHQQFSPALRAYTRTLTAAWVAYFVGMVMLSALLYLLAPWPWWSLFCNLFTPLAAVLFFVGEYVLRYLRHPEFERVSLRATLAAYRANAAAAQGGAAK